MWFVDIFRCAKDSGAFGLFDHTSWTIMLGFDLSFVVVVGSIRDMGSNGGIGRSRR